LSSSDDETNVRHETRRHAERKNQEQAGVGK
jgi:hypothetical protein